MYDKYAKGNLYFYNKVGYYNGDAKHFYISSETDSLDVASMWVLNTISQNLDYHKRDSAYGAKISLIYKASDGTIHTIKELKIGL